MYVTQIEVSEFPKRNGAAMKHAHVLFQTETRHVQLQCTIRAEEPQARSRLAFIREAIRQMRRMPEYRSGENIQFSPDISEDHAFLA